MDPLIKTQIGSYLNYTFIQALDRFEELVHNSSKDISKSNYIDVYLGNDNLLNVKPASALSPGFNKNVAVELTVLRVLWNQFYTFLLTTDKLPVTCETQLFCIVIETTEFQAPFFQYWKKELGLMSVLFVKEPYIEAQMHNDQSHLQIIRVVVENAEIKQSSKCKCDISEIKKIGNDLYNKADYVNALAYYEYCLACCHNNLDMNVRTTRAILYNNSAASLYKLNLYDASLKYSEITTRLDREYYKPYVWKVHCLLQKKFFQVIPNFLVILQSKVKDPEDFAKINIKYSVYLSNSLGMYNWKHISQVKKTEVAVADYFYKHIGLRVHESRPVYYALQNIKKQTLLIISKPLVYDKKGIHNKSALCERISKAFDFQKSFAKNIRDILSFSDGFDNKKADNKATEKKQIGKFVDKCLIKPKDICDGQNQALGIWPDFFKFGHNCSPNCSIVHFDNIMIISTCSNINKGEMFTIDLASDVTPLKRKQYLLKKYNIFCKCPICQWKNWPDFSNQQQVFKVTDSLSNITMIKQVFWQLLSSTYAMHQQNLLQKSINLVVKQISWSDMLNAIKLLRLNNQKIADSLIQIMVAGFRSFLKIPNQLGLQIVNNIK